MNAFRTATLVSLSLAITPPGFLGAETPVPPNPVPGFREREHLRRQGLSSMNQGHILVASQTLQRASDLGDGEATRLLGFLYQEGKVGKTDPAKAVTSYQSAIRQGSVSAYFNLGKMHDGDHGLPESDQESRRWFEKGAQAGQPTCMHQLAWGYREGKFETQDYAQAMFWFQRAAAKNEGVSMNAIARLYWNGQGVPKDEITAVLWFRKAARAGDSARSLTYLGEAYRDGRGVKANREEALRWFRLALASEEIDPNDRENARKAVEGMGF